MNIFGAFLDGVFGTFRTKRYLMMVYLISLAVAVTFGASLSAILKESLGSSAAAERTLQSFDPLWYEAYSQEANGLARSFDPSVTGIGAVLNGLDSLLRGNLFEGYRGVVSAGLVYLLMWTFFSGGFIAIYAARGQKPLFFKSAARFFPRFVVLIIIAAVIYFLLFFFLFDWLSDAVRELTRETLDERAHFAYTVVKYLIVWLLVWIVNMLIDYSKIMTVITDRGNFITGAFLGIGRALRVVFGNFGKTFGLYLLIGLLWIALMLLYWLVVPGAEDSNPAAIVWVFILGQIYIFFRIAVRCCFYAGQTAMAAAILRKAPPERPEIAPAQESAS